VFVECGPNNGDCQFFDTCVNGECCQPTVTGCTVLSGSCDYKIDNGCGVPVTCTCNVGVSCVDGTCEGTEPCIPSCPTGASCGHSDGCGGFCPGSCPSGGSCIALGARFYCFSVGLEPPSCEDVECGLCLDPDHPNSAVTEYCESEPGVFRLADCLEGNICSGSLSACDPPCGESETCNTQTGKCECCGLFDFLFGCTTCDKSISVCVGTKNAATCCALFFPTSICL
jgi:hypothetical protein